MASVPSINLSSDNSFLDEIRSLLKHLVDIKWAMSVDILTLKIYNNTVNSYVKATAAIFLTLL